MRNGHRVIGTADLLGVLARAFLIQASWSFERMQSLGFAYAIAPALRKLYPDRAEREARLRLHCGYFNTQPYLASFILGAAVRLEEDRATGRNASPDVQGLKASLMAPLGALGDSFFWGSLKPFAAVAAVALVLTGFGWAPLLFLLVFNAGHVAVRAGALFQGYRSAGDAVALMTRYRFTSGARLLKVTSLTLVGGIIGMKPLWIPAFAAAPLWPPWLAAASGLALTLMLTAILRKGSSPLKLMLGLAAGCLGLAFAGVI